MDMVKVMVNVQCPLCGFFRCLGSVEAPDISGAMTGQKIPFRVDYRVWSGGRAKGITQKERLNRGYIHQSLSGAWRSFVQKIEMAFKAVEMAVFIPPVLTKVLVPGDLTRAYDTPRLVR